MKERRIGEVFEQNGKRYEVVLGGLCGVCDLKEDCDNVMCSDMERRDGKSVHFKEMQDEKI